MPYFLFGGVELSAPRKIPQKERFKIIMKNTKYGIRYIIEDRLKNVGIPLDKNSAINVLNELAGFLGYEVIKKDEKTKEKLDVYEIIHDVLLIIDFILDNIEPKDKDAYTTFVRMLNDLLAKVS